MKAIVELAMDTSHMTVAEKLSAAMKSVGESFFEQDKAESQPSATLRDKDDKVIGTIKIVD